MINTHSTLREFGRCRLDVGKKLLWADDEPVRLPLKAIELLCLLVENSGAVVTKDEIWNGVWKGTFVEETNLTHNIYLLRKAFKDLGEESLIKTIPRRGYRFTAEVREVPSNDVVIERHAFSRTLIEDLTPPETAAGPATDVRGRTRLAVALGIGATLVALFAGAYFGLRERVSASPQIRSMAVLPLHAVDADSAAAHRGLGLADTLITRLSSLKEIVVRPTSAVTQFEDQPFDSLAVGRSLNVEAVLEGSIYQTGNDVRVTMRLVSIPDGKTIWSGEFDKPLQDELRLQNEIALRVADALVVNLDPQEKRSLTKRYTDNRDAFEAYLRGRFIFDRRDPAIYPKAIAEFQRAIDLDRNYALAYSGLADVYSMQANDADDSQRNVLYEKAKATLEQALAIDDELGEAHTSLAWIKRIHEWDWPGSEREFKRALELNPNYYNAHMWYSFLLITLDRKDEALAEIEKARELAPLNQTVINNYATIRYFRQDNDTLLPIAAQVEDLGARDYMITLLRANILLRLRAYDQVITLINDFEARNNNRPYNTLESTLAAAYALSGQMDKAQPLINALEKEAAATGEAAYRLSLVFADMGRDDEAIALLEKCAATHDDRMMWIKVEPRFDHLRADPRFREIVEKMNLPS